MNDKGRERSQKKIKKVPRKASSKMASKNTREPIIGDEMGEAGNNASSKKDHLVTFGDKVGGSYEGSRETASFVVKQRYPTPNDAVSDIHKAKRGNSSTLHLLNVDLRYAADSSTTADVEEAYCSETPFHGTAKYHAPFKESSSVLSGINAKDGLEDIYARGEKYDDDEDEVLSQYSAMTETEMVKDAVSPSEVEPLEVVDNPFSLSPSLNNKGSADKNEVFKRDDLLKMVSPLTPVSEVIMSVKSDSGNVFTSLHQQHDDASTCGILTVFEERPHAKENNTSDANQCVSEADAKVEGTLTSCIELTELGVPCHMHEDATLSKIPKRLRTQEKAGVKESLKKEINHLARVQTSEISPSSPRTVLLDISPQETELSTKKRTAIRKVSSKRSAKRRKKTRDLQKTPLMNASLNKVSTVSGFAVKCKTASPANNNASSSRGTPEYTNLNDKVNEAPPEHELVCNSTTFSEPLTDTFEKETVSLIQEQADSDNILYRSPATMDSTSNECGQRMCNTLLSNHEVETSNVNQALPQSPQSAPKSQLNPVVHEPTDVSGVTFEEPTLPKQKGNVNTTKQGRRAKQTRKTRDTQDTLPGPSTLRILLNSRDSLIHDKHKSITWETLRDSFSSVLSWQHSEYSGRCPTLSEFKHISAAGVDTQNVSENHVQFNKHLYSPTDTPRPPDKEASPSLDKRLFSTLADLVKTLELTKYPRYNTKNESLGVVNGCPSTCYTFPLKVAFLDDASPEDIILVSRVLQDALELKGFRRVGCSRALGKENIAFSEDSLLWMSLVSETSPCIGPYSSVVYSRYTFLVFPTMRHKNAPLQRVMDLKIQLPQSTIHSLAQVIMSSTALFRTLPKLWRVRKLPEVFNFFFQPKDLKVIPVLNTLGLTPVHALPSPLYVNLASCQLVRAHNTQLTFQLQLTPTKVGYLCLPAVEVHIAQLPLMSESDMEAAIKPAALEYAAYFPVKPTVGIDNSTTKRPFSPLDFVNARKRKISMQY